MQPRQIRNRRRLLDAARAALVTEGYGGAGVNGIAKTAKLTIGALYSHFATKQALFEAVVADVYDIGCAQVHQLQSECGAEWPNAFVDRALAIDPPTDWLVGPLLCSIHTDAARSSFAAQQAVDAGLTNLLLVLAAGLSDHDTQRARVLITIVLGAQSIAQACADKTIAAQGLAEAREMCRRLLV